MENDLSECCVRSKAMPGCFRSRHCHFRLSCLRSTAMAAGFFERRGIRAPAAVFRQHEQGIKIQTRPAGGGGKIVKNRANPIFWPSTSAGSVLALCWPKLRVPSVSSSESASPGGCSEAVREDDEFQDYGNVVSPCAAECHADAHGIKDPFPPVVLSGL